MFALNNEDQLGVESGQYGTFTDYDAFVLGLTISLLVISEKWSDAIKKINSKKIPIIYFYICMEIWI